MKKFSIIITDTLHYNSIYLIEDDNEKAFIAKVISYHETGRSDLGEEGEKRDEITDTEVSRLLPRLRSGKHTDVSHGITRYTYRFITFNGSLVPDS
jgi:hypothetical protein